MKTIVSLIFLAAGSALSPCIVLAQDALNPEAAAKVIDSTEEGLVGRLGAVGEDALDTAKADAEREADRDLEKADSYLPGGETASASSSSDPADSNAAIEKEIDQLDQE